MCYLNPTSCSICRRSFRTFHYEGFFGRQLIVRNSVLPEDLESMLILYVENTKPIEMVLCWVKESRFEKSLCSLTLKDQNKKIKIVQIE